MLKRSLAEEDTRLALLVAWGVGLPVITLFSWYIGTVAVSKHIVDLQLGDLHAAGIFAVIGAAIGAIVASVFTLIYPRVAFADLKREWHEPELAHEPGGAPDIIPNIGPGDMSH